MVINTDFADYINSAESLEDRQRRKQQLFFLLYSSPNSNTLGMLKKLIEDKTLSRGGLKYG